MMPARRAAEASGWCAFCGKNMPLDEAGRCPAPHWRSSVDALQRQFHAVHEEGRRGALFEAALHLELMSSRLTDEPPIKSVFGPKEREALRAAAVELRALSQGVKR